ncbi:MAG: CDP-alcohol phosphatidyltransferase family protein [Rhodovibrionaceae bacterium]
MASIYDLKPAFQNRLRPAAAKLAAAGVTANQVTLAALALSLLAGLVLAASGGGWVFLLLPPLFLARMALNALDGMLARGYGQQSRLGAVLNEICDVISDAALILPFALVPRLDAGLIVLLALLAAIVEFAGLLSQALGGARNYAGPLGKSDRALAFSLLAILVGCGWAGGWLAALLLWLLLLLALLTLWNRLRAAVRA